MSEITPETRVYEIFRKYPEAVDYLLEIGICECAGLQGMKKTLREQAEELNMDVEKIVEKLNQLVSKRE